MKRFQECNWLVKLWRYRHYLYIPFKWVYYQYTSFYITDDQTYEQERVNGYNLWKLLIGIAQHDMAWYHTMEEVKAMFKYRSDDDEGGYEGFIDLEDDIDDTEYWKGID